MQRIGLSVLCWPIVTLVGCSLSTTPPPPPDDEPALSADSFAAECSSQMPTGEGRVVCADLAALEQTLVYNRFGSFNPYGMIFALRRDLTSSDIEVDVGGNPNAAGRADAGGNANVAINVGAGENANAAGEIDGSENPDEVGEVRVGESAGAAGEEVAARENIDAAHCAGLTGTETYTGKLEPGYVRLKDCKRPRPVVLRVNVGDTLLLRVTNLLSQPEPPDFSRDVCRDRRSTDEGRRRVRIGVREGTGSEQAHGEAACLDRLAEKAASEIEPDGPEATHAPDWPATRLVNLVAQGLHPLADPESGLVDPVCRGLDAVAPGEAFRCRYSVDQEGTYFFASQAAPAGGEGDGGSIVHGLFGAVVAERAGSSWYRSQVSAAALDVAWQRSASPGTAPVALPGANPHVRTGSMDYEAAVDGIPVLNMARTIDDTHLELVHTDLNAIIWCDAARRDPASPSNCRSGTDELDTTVEPGFAAFREFSVFFHDELKTFYTKNFEELGKLGQLAGVKDGFAINYGASGMGSLLLANRKGIGPSADCMECLYEEFFLTSWANGDPALLEWYADDPSNVHHSYLNDPVVFRNFHAGPKETHVFHLHAHQWFGGNDPNRGAYLDSQTVGPQQGFTYNIYHGGLRRQNGGNTGWWDTQGSGNRNRTVGDSIFHCHLYPHFAQGMWALWRVHDVLEDGTRLLPDGQAHAGLSLEIPGPGDTAHKRAGSVDRISGAWRKKQEGTPIPALVPLPGEPLPLLPTYADIDADASVVEADVATAAGASTTADANADVGAKALPGAGANMAADADVATAGRVAATATPMPGYPFYIAGRPGHRPPQAPLDIARNLGANPGASTDDDTDTRLPLDPGSTDEWLDGGLGRHVVADGSIRELGIEVPERLDDGTPVASLSGDRQTRFWSQVVAKSFTLGDLSGHLTQAAIEPLSPWGTPLERAAMGFHFNGKRFEAGGGSGADLKLARVDGEPVTLAVEGGAYATLRANTPSAPAAPALTEALFPVNGSAPKPGAPFADPCGVARGDAPPVADPLGLGWLTATNFRPDPHLEGYRRYETSAVQLDMVVNSAGWHDPQARINVLTAESDYYKDGPDWRISPLISDKEEPFFFRALSGECIEFRHTNELPKELELDDFQVKTPTDTVGQHIHLVKFDVTSSDGSGNGWNYEDGTLAPDEIATRLCAWADTGDEAGKRAVEEAAAAAGLPAGDSFCDWDVHKRHDLWRQRRSEHPGLFQTTVQRWFADPILSLDGPGVDPVDRTMRTVFTHDHFGPSSIQQHGFYGALVVEPPPRLNRDEDTVLDPEERLAWSPRICPPDSDAGCDRPLGRAERRGAVAWGGKAWEGARKRVIVALNERASKADPAYFEHPNYREFALSIADFALLYDPRDRDDPDAVRDLVSNDSRRTEGDLDGMAKLYCESYWRLSPARLDSVCGSAAQKDAEDGSWFYSGEVPPAWIAGGVNRDDRHRDRYAGDLFGGERPDGSPLDGRAEIRALGDHLVEYRQKAAGTWRPDVDNFGAAMAGPIAAPVRPESISVDHHDPYLVNYRGAPLPLRIGTKNADGSASSDCEPKRIARAGIDGAHPDRDGTGEEKSEVVTALEDGRFEECSIVHQKRDEEGGDMGEALHSAVHGDPETPVLEAYQNERLVFRMIQGAQEVQHAFTVAGQPFKRNIDQHWGQGMQPLDTSATWQANPTLQSACLERPAFSIARPREYRAWLDTARARWAAAGIDEGHWEAYEKALAECDNLEGFAFAQEIGISEHFEMQGSLRADVGTSAEFAPPPEPEGAGEAPRTEDGVPTGSSDYLYSFGTTDALWNGAWGLIRVFSDEDSTDPTTFDDAAEGRIGDRLDRVATFGSDIEDAESSVSATSPRAHTGLACPIPAAGETRRQVDAVVVALEMRRAFPTQDGTRFGDGLYDPDGLFLALMSPEALGTRGIDDEAGFAALEAESVLASVRTVYGTQPEPFVLRAHAGDCLRLRVVNLLGEEDGARDRLGDAVMPRIVPLNTDPMPAIAHTENASGAPGERSVGVLALPEGLATGVRPSTRLALDFGLPGLDLIRSLPSGYGFNKPALDGGNGGVSVSGLMLAYAGRVRLDLAGDTGEAMGELGRVAARRIHALARAANADEMSGHVLKSLWSRLRAIDPEGLDATALDDAIEEVFDIVHRPEEPDGSALGQALGESFGLELWNGDTAPFAPGVTPLADECGTDCDDPGTLNDELARLLDRVLREALDERTHWIPYAFGAVPVKPLADVISQLPHGLFGAIDVVPTTWTARDDDGLACDPVNAGGYERCSANYVAPTGSGNAFAWSAEAEDGSPVELREFVLFWRDGMNLRDDRSALPWRWNDADGSSVRDPDGSTAHMVPDCPVCDDSYDRGEGGVNHLAPSFARLLQTQLPADEGGAGAIHRSDDLNAFAFPPDHLAAATESLTLSAREGEQVVIRVVHPGGRARQRAFAMNGYSYDDLFPGFGFPRSALLAPGKSISAWLRPAAAPGTFVWHDGPTHLRAAGTWGLLSVGAGDDE